MAHVPIPKDLTRVKTKFALGLTRRQIICFASALVMGLPLFFLTKEYIPISASAFLMVLVMVPWFLFAMYERNGQPLERHLRNVIHLRYLQHKHRTYETENLYSVCAKQAKLLREVREIAGKN